MKDENSPEAKQLFHGAQSYEKAFLILDKMASTSPTTFANLFQPVITCVLLSLELYFKCLITLERNGYPCIHEFSLLYKELVNGTRNSILEMLYKINQDTAKFIQTIYTHENIADAFLTEAAFVSYLEEHDKDLINWRYMIGKKGTGINTGIMHTIIEAVKLVIKAKCPTIELE